MPMVVEDSIDPTVWALATRGAAQALSVAGWRVAVPATASLVEDHWGRWSSSQATIAATAPVAAPLRVAAASWNRSVRVGRRAGVRLIACLHVPK
jgi:hypothetical protein